MRTRNPEQWQDIFTDALMGGIAEAETGDFPNRWIRTANRPAGGSTAFGPHQITQGLAKDMFTRYPKLMAPHQAYYTNTFLPMTDKFRIYGNAPTKEGWHPRYDYYRPAPSAEVKALDQQIAVTKDPVVLKDLTDRRAALHQYGIGIDHANDAALQKAYNDMARTLVRSKAARLYKAKATGGKLLGPFIKDWHGKTPNKRYIDTLTNEYNRRLEAAYRAALTAEKKKGTSK